MRRGRGNRLLALLLCLQLSAGTALAAGGGGQPGSGFSLMQELSDRGSGSEFVSGNYPGAILMQVNLWGSIGKPGIHHVPVRTDLVTLLSLAGGTQADADLDRITIKRRISDREELLRIDGEKLLTETGMKSPQLEPNDIIVIPRSKPTIHPNTVATVGFVGSILGIVLASFALSTALKK